MRGSMLIKGCNYEEHLQLSEYQVILRLKELLNTPAKERWAIVEDHGSRMLISVHREGTVCNSHDSLYIVVSKDESNFDEIMNLIKEKVDRIKYFDYTRK